MTSCDDALKEKRLDLSRCLIPVLSVHSDFVEQEHGVINGRAFREAINGVFRSRVHNKKQKTPTSSARKSASLASNREVGGSTSVNYKRPMPPQLDHHMRGFDEDDDEDF